MSFDKPARACRGLCKSTLFESGITGAFFLKLPLATVFGAAIACVGLSANVAVAQTSTLTALTWSSPEHRVLLIEPEVKLGEITAGGIVEPRADWSDRAAHALQQSLSAALGQHGIKTAALETLSDPHDVQLAKLHAIVGTEILIYQLGFSRLPTKKSPLDWTLGPGVNEMRLKHGADYGMFVYVRDTYSSNTRKAMMLLGMATGGTQGAFVSLVDLRTGNIVWFNRVVSGFGAGDLRDGSGAPAFATELLKGSPL